MRGTHATRNGSLSPTPSILSGETETSSSRGETRSRSSYELLTKWPSQCPEADWGACEAEEGFVYFGRPLVTDAQTPVLP